MWKQIKIMKNGVFSYLKHHELVLIVIFYAGVVTDALFIPIKSDLITFGLLGYYVVLLKMYRVQSRMTFGFCLFLLFLMYVLFVNMGPKLQTEKLAVWLVLLLFTGVIQQWNE